MYNKILLLDSGTNLGEFWAYSLISEGYEVITHEKPEIARKQLDRLKPDLVIINAVEFTARRVKEAEALAWTVPVITITGDQPLDNSEEHIRLPVPFAFQDLLLLVQDALYHRTLVGHRPFQLSIELIDEIEELLGILRQDLRARCVILSSSSGRLIKTAGTVEQGTAISLAALVAAGFVATARASQLLGHGEMFDSNLQESEGYGLYAIRLHDKLILSVDFSARITVGMVRHYTAQAAVDILELLVQNAQRQGDFDELDLNENFRDTVNDALSNLLED